MPSETVEKTRTGSDFSKDGEALLEATADSSGTVRPEVVSALSAAGPQIDPADEESNSDSDTVSDDINDKKSFCYRYRESWVCQSAAQTEKKFKCISRASLFPKSPFLRSLRPARWNRLLRFQSSGRTPSKSRYIILPCRHSLRYPSALRGS